MKRILAVLIVCGWFGITCADGAFQLHGLFTDNMVLQREAPVAVYGTGDDGEQITVEINGQQASARVTHGQWKAMLPAMKAGGPFTMKVTGASTVTLHNVLIGDVWICTGQSNMAGMLRSYMGDGYKEYRDLYQGHPQTNSMLRLFKLKQDGADEPQRDVVTDETFGAIWRDCEEDSALQFSALGYLFGVRLQKEIGVPVGLIYATLGGTSAECWMSGPTLRSRPEFQPILDNYEKAKAHYPQAFEQYQKQLAEWKAKPASERKGGRAPMEPMGPAHPKRPSGLYNFMIAPLQRFTIKGAIWYQGEGNANQAVQYRTLFPALITSWRQQWGVGDFPFLFVQLAAFHAMNPEPEDTAWARLREAQTMTLALPRTGMAVAIDVGHQTNIHPPNKPVVAERLVAAALKVAYGRDIVAEGPMFKHMTVKGRQAVIAFDHVGGGLVSRAVELDGHRVPADPIQGFSLCGEDKKFHWADAVIDGDTIVVSCPRVDKPVAVRYAWADFPFCNLYNKAGFPAVPFRTDTFDQQSAGGVTGIAVGKPFVCSHPIGNGRFGGLTDGDLTDNNTAAFATNGALTFPKTVTVDLRGRFHIKKILVHNSAMGGTKTVEVQVSTDGQAFQPVGKTEFKNYSADIFELGSLNLSDVGFVRLVFPDVHPISFQRKPNGFIFIRELEAHGIPVT